MCIAIFKPKESKVSKKTLKRCFTANPDGAGYMYPEHGKMVVKRGFFTFKAFWSSYSKMLNKAVDIGIHFRIATSGKVDTKNCHPHTVNNSLAFIHNGILAIDVKKASLVSDTVLFNQQIVKKLQDGFIKNTAFDYLIESFIKGSKMVFMSGDGTVKIYNETDGHWKDGVWFSNGTYKKATDYGYYQDYGTYYKNDSPKIETTVIPSSDWLDGKDDYPEYLSESFSCDSCDTELLDKAELELMMCRFCTEGNHRAVA
tara:strand:+ start:1622 stop:2392 length:771 start_codon:yes stop_codon:yes gene_type:complete